ncbi:hypothetical protein HDV03_001112 [Kappamyces sp. JEL0829]|nr:hypothetical protein HDV03_001112 [Kappamyces sp. JEL0829]
MSSGLVQRKKVKEDEEVAAAQDSESFKQESYGDAQDLTIMEEIVLLGLKDSEVLRGAILVELSFRNRISCIKDPRKPALAERNIKVDDDALTGEVLLDETLRYLKTDTDSVANWIDLLSGETWNLYKIGYQLKQVRERISKGLVDKGVLRTEKKSFVLFDLPTHPVSNPKVKENLIQRLVDALLGRGAKPDRRTVACLCAAYAANVLENAFVGLSHAQKEQAFTKVDEMLKSHASLSDKARSIGTTEVMAGVLSVYSKMDSIL